MVQIINFYHFDIWKYNHDFWGRLWDSIYDQNENKKSFKNSYWLQCGDQYEVSTWFFFTNTASTSERDLELI